MNLVQFDQSIISNLLQGKTKPFLLREMISIKSDSAIVLYTALDVYLSNYQSNHRELTSTRIFRKILYLQGARYDQKHIRKQELKKLVEELNGKKISTGATLRLQITETSGGQDWKLVARAIYPNIQTTSQAKMPKMQKVNDEAMVAIIVEDIRQATGIEGEGEVLEIIATHYSFDLINHALGVYKADYQGQAKKPIALFQGILHGLAHKAGMEWIFGCGPDCKH